MKFLLVMMLSFGQFANTAIRQPGKDQPYRLIGTEFANTRQILDLYQTLLTRSDFLRVRSLFRRFNIDERSPIPNVRFAGEKVIVDSASLKFDIKMHGPDRIQIGGRFVEFSREMGLADRLEHLASVLQQKEKNAGLLESLILPKAHAVAISTFIVAGFIIGGVVVAITEISRKISEQQEISETRRRLREIGLKVLIKFLKDPESVKCDPVKKMYVVEIEENGEKRKVPLFAVRHAVDEYAPGAQHDCVQNPRPELVKYSWQKIVAKLRQNLSAGVQMRDELVEAVQAVQ